MIERVIDFSVRSKFLVLLLIGAAAVGGAWSLERVPLDTIPDLSDTQVIVYTRWDRSPEVVEAEITYSGYSGSPWEDSFATMSLSRCRSANRPSFP